MRCRFDPTGGPFLDAMTFFLEVGDPPPAAYLLRVHDGGWPYDPPRHVVFVRRQGPNGETYYEAAQG